MGGITLTGAGGDRVLVYAASRWTVFVVLVAFMVLVDVVILVAGGTDTPPMIAAAIMTAALGGAAIAALVWARRRTRRRLVIDGTARACTIVDGNRVALHVPAALVQRTWIQVYSVPSYADVFDVLVDVGNAELWIAQVLDESDASELANTIARCLGVPFDSSVRRKG